MDNEQDFRGPPLERETLERAILLLRSWRQATRPITKWMKAVEELTEPKKPVGRSKSKEN